MQLTRVPSFINIKAIMLIAYILLSTLTYTVYQTVFSTLTLFRSIIYLILKAVNLKRIQLLENADVFWTIGETYHNLINIIMVLNKKNIGENSIVSDIKRVVQERMLDHPDKFGKYMCSLHTLMGYPYLLREEVKADDVITILKLNESDHSSLQDIIYNYSNEPMPKNKLLWEIIVIVAPLQWKKDNNIQEHQTPLFLRVNQTLGDDFTVMNLFSKVFGEGNTDFNLNPLNAIGNVVKKGFMDYLKKFGLSFLVPGYVIVEYLKGIKYRMNAPKTTYKHNVSFASEKNGDCLIESITNLRRELNGVSFSEIMLTVISASIFEHFQKNYHKVPESLDLAVVTDNGFVNMQVPLKTDNPSLINRLELVQNNSKVMMNSLDLLIRSYINSNLTHLLPTPLTKRMFPLNGVWGNVSNLPAFQRMVLFNGYEVEEFYVFNPQRDEMATGFSIVNYYGKLHFGFVADVASVASKEDCNEILIAVFRNIDLLKLEVKKKKLNIM